MEEKQNLLSAAAVAKRLNISRATLSRLVASGQLGVYRVGHKTMFDEQLLNEYKAAILQPRRNNARALSA